MIKSLPPKPENFLAELQRFQDLCEHIGRLRFMAPKIPSMDTNMDFLLKEQKRLFDEFVNFYRDRLLINRDSAYLFPFNKKQATVLGGLLFCNQRGVDIQGIEGIEDKEFKEIVEFLLCQFESLLNDWEKPWEKLHD